jgi:hypothetical protein
VYNPEMIESYKDNQPVKKDADLAEEIVRSVGKLKSTRRGFLNLVTGGILNPNRQTWEMLARMGVQAASRVPISKDLTTRDNTTSQSFEEFDKRAAEEISDQKWLGWDEMMVTEKDIRNLSDIIRGSKSHFLDDIRDVRTLDELKEIMGPLSEEEQVILKQVDLHSDPTPEELAFMGTDFIDRVQEKVAESLKRREKV